MSSPPAVRIVYGPTGGRFPMMFGIAEALETSLKHMGVNILDRVGISGGAIVAAVRASNEDFTDWISVRADLSKHCSVFGWKTPIQLANLIFRGGLLNSKRMLKTTFQKMFTKPPSQPCWAVSWCKSSNKAVAFNLTNNPMVASMVMASTAVPIAFSPVVISNSDLSPETRASLGVTMKGVSTFADGGLSGVFPARLIDKQVVPTIMVFIDPLPPIGESPKSDLWDRWFGFQNKSYLLAQSARRKKTTQIYIVPSPPEFEKHRLRFKLTMEEAMTMYLHGKVMAEQSFRFMLSLSPENLNQEDGERQGNTNESLRSEQTFIQIVHSQEREDQVTQAVSKQSDTPEA